MSKVLVGLLTIEQRDSLIGQLFASDSFFNPIETANENQWVISQEEMQQNVNPSFDWVKELPMIEYKPITEQLI